MLIGNEKKKRRGGYAAVIGALAMYGAYRLIAGVKNACTCGASSMMNLMKKMKKKMPEMDICPKEDDGDLYDG